MEAMEELIQLSESMMQASALLADEDVDEKSPSRRTSTFLNVVALGNVGAGKSAVMNSLIGHPILPTGENGATRAPISIDLQMDNSLNSKSIILQIDSKSQQVSASALRHSLQDKLSKVSGKSRGDEIYLKLRTSTAPPLKLVDLPGLDQRAMDESVIGDYAARNDAILLVVVPAAQAPEISSLRALRLAKEFDAEATRTVGVISKIDQAAGDQKALAAVQALLLNQGPPRTSDIPWVALIGQSASAQAGSVGSENSLEIAWRAETESLRSILTGGPQSKLGRLALVDALAKQIRGRMKIRLPNLLSGDGSSDSTPRPFSRPEGRTDEVAPCSSRVDDIPIDPDVKVLCSIAPQAPEGVSAPLPVKIGVQTSIALTWNDCYVGLKDSYFALQEELHGVRSSFSELKGRRDRDISRFRQIEVGLQLELEQSQAEVQTEKTLVEKTVRLLEDSQAMMVCQDAELVSLKAEVERLSSLERTTELKAAGVAEYKDSIDYIRDCSLLSEEIQEEVWSKEAEPQLEDEREMAFMRGMAKTLRLVARTRGCDVAGLGVGDLSEDECSASDAEGKE